MSENVRYFRLGLFVLIALALLVAVVAVLGGGEWFKKGVEFETYMNESVQGLDVGSPVKYRGVQVGKVTEIDFVLGQYWLPPETRDRYAGTVLVRMNIEPRKLLPLGGVDDTNEFLQRQVEAGLRVRIASMSIAGPSYLEADYLAGRASPPMEIAWTPRGLYLPSSPSTNVQVVSAVERLASQLENVRIDVLMEDLHELVVDVDTVVKQADIPTVSKEVTALAAELRQTNTQLQAVLADVPPLIGKTQAFVEQAQSVVGDPNVGKALSESAELATSLRQSADRINTLLAGPRMDQILDGLSAAAQQAGPAAADLRQTVATLRRALQSAGRDLNTVTATLRTAAANLDSFAQEAKDNPKRLLFGQPPPRTSPGEKQ